MNTFVLNLFQKYYQYFMNKVHGSKDEDKKMLCGDYLNAFIDSCKTYGVVIKKVCVWLINRAELSTLHV
jgi:hypothetical protein